MKRVAVTTVRDEGAAQVAKEALNDAGIDVEIKRQNINPYFASMTAMTYEVRVPEDRVVEAEQVLARISAELEQALIAEAGAAADHEHEHEHEHETPADQDSAPPRKLGVARIGYLFFGLVFAGVLFVALYAYWEGR